MDNTPDEIEEEKTTPEPARTMAELVFDRELPLSDLYHDDEIPCAPFGIGGY